MRPEREDRRHRLAHPGGALSPGATDIPKPPARLRHYGNRTRPTCHKVSMNAAMRVSI